MISFPSVNFKYNWNIKRRWVLLYNIHHSKLTLDDNQIHEFL